MPNKNIPMKQAYANCKPPTSKRLIFFIGILLCKLVQSKSKSDHAPLVLPSAREGREFPLPQGLQAEFVQFGISRSPFHDRIVQDVSRRRNRESDRDVRLDILRARPRW